MKPKSSLSKRLIKLIKALVTKEKRAQIINVNNEREDIITNPTDIQRIRYYFFN